MVKQKFINRGNEILNLLKKNTGKYLLKDQIYLETCFSKSPSFTPKEYQYVMRLLKGDKRVKKIKVGNIIMYGYDVDNSL